MPSAKTGGFNLYIKMAELLKYYVAKPFAGLKVGQPCNVLPEHEAELLKGGLISKQKPKVVEEEEESK